MTLAGCGQTLNLEDLGVDQGVGLPNGTACSGGSTDCASGFCVDGVCCESACTGICEACNVTGQAGTCSAIAKGTDPAMECMPQPLPTPPDGGTDDGGIELNLPDAGIHAMSGPCAPSCNGNRACGFPDQTVKCGDSFCNTTTQVGEGACDGEGHCGVSTTDCVAYVCGANACKTSCASDTDCQTGYYCDGSLECAPKKGLGITCDSNPDECQSGYCADDVCCNSACTFNGGVCNQAGSVGQCHCVTNYPPKGSTQCNGTCEYYYLDADNDGYGSKTDSGIVGCTGDANDPPPAGRVAASATAVNQDGVTIPSGNNDCGDDDSRVNPGITTFNTAANWTSVWSPQFDWNCDGTVGKQYPYLPGATCEFCNPESHSIFVGGSCGGSQATCVTANQLPSLDCFYQQENSCPSGHLCLISYCCGIGCANPGFLGVNTWAFVSGGFACGTAGTAKWCDNACANAGDNVSLTPGITFSETQGCL